MKLENVLATKGMQTFTITPGESVAEAVRILAEQNVGALVVLDERERVVGILSERDITRSLARSRDTLDLLVRDLMSTSITTGSSSDDADAVLQTMTNRRFRHLPVVQDNRLVGVVTIGDLVKARLAEAEGTLETLETQILNS